MRSDVWEGASEVLLKYFWGWSPETWGTLSFSNGGRRSTIRRESGDPFIAVVCVSQDAPDRELAGKVAGFYEVSHLEGHRNEFTDPSLHTFDRYSWQYGLKAQRAFSFLPEYRINTYDLDPSIRSRVRAVGTWGEWLDDEKVERLRNIPYVEVPVFGGPDFIVGNIHIPSPNNDQHAVKAGPVNRAGYEVPGEPPDTEKELYALELVGDADRFLQSGEGALRIFKIGFSISPRTRLEAFRKSLPRGRYQWELFRSTRLDGHMAYPSFEAAEKGERAMKMYLGQRGQARWLGGEFYAATEAEIGEAWAMGREASLSYSAVDLIR